MLLRDERLDGLGERTKERQNGRVESYVGVSWQIENKSGEGISDSVSHGWKVASRVDEARFHAAERSGARLVPTCTGASRKGAQGAS